MRRGPWLREGPAIIGDYRRCANAAAGSAAAHGGDATAEYNVCQSEWILETWKRNKSTRSPTPSPGCSNALPICGGIFDFAVKAERLAAVAKALEDPGIWNDPKRAQELGRERKQLEDVVGTLTGLGTRLKDSAELFDLARGERDDATLSAVATDVAELERAVGDMEFRRMFHNPMDPNPCFIDIQAGSGGTEAQDWAAMLLRMYLRYCERKGYRTEILEESEGEVAGIKSASVKVTGDYAYGYLRTETGVHRLVRKSPFDSNARRHTSFASVFVYPEVDETIDVEINPAELRIDTFRASGAGGQHINKTDIGWGHQIRSYVLDQSRIKDLRTNIEVGNTQAVLDGDLDDFIGASLKQGV